ncbi:MAG TPA: hypothetical protein VKY22_15280 [Bradyrhizobium sp.]|nr:hypothetical protein [Bradyrhizobium sp.]
MFDFTLEWVGRRSVAEREKEARAVTEQLHARDALIFPAILLIGFLFALSIMTSAHLHGRANDALPYLISGGMGMPMPYPSSASCRRPSNLGSVQRLQQAEVLALLAAH